MNKSVSYSLLIAVVFTTVYCKRDSDILATFKGGTVLRSDLRTFYEVKEIQINKNSSSIQNQSAIIEDIALQKIAFTEYSNKYPVLPEEYNNLVSFIDGQLTAQLIKREFVENLKKSKEVEFAETQLVFIKKDKTGNPDRIRATRILSEINNLKSNKEIAEYVSKNTDEEARKSIGGLLEPHCMNCGNDPLKEILSNAGKEIQDKKFILKELDGNIYIIRVIETRKVSPSDIEKFVTRKFNEFHSMATAYKENAKSEQEKQSAAYYADDKLKEKAKMTAEHILKQFENNLWIDEYNKLKKNSQLTISGKATAKPTELKESDYLESTEILTKKDGTKFTFGDLEKEFKKINIFNRKAANPTRKDEIMERLNFFNQIYLPSYIFSQSPEAAKIRKTEKFIRSFDMVKRSIAFTLMQKDIQNKVFTVSAKEMTDTYEAGKLYAYSAPSKSKPSERTPLPFESVKTRIKEELENSKRKAEFDKLTGGFKKDYSLKVAVEQLEAGSI